MSNINNNNNNVPKLSRWHYQQIAKKVAVLPFSLASEAAVKLTGTNERFDPQRFLNACQDIFGRDIRPSRATKTKFTGKQKQWLEDNIGVRL